MKIPVGISSCLLGERVRYDGGHKQNSYVMQSLGEYFDFRSFCPELAIGMTVPRKPIRLVRKRKQDIQCVAVDNPNQDFTEQLVQCTNEQKHWHKSLCGYILKRSSPSCGMERVKVWDDVMPTRDGVGIYAGQLQKNMPHLPVEEEGRLGDAVIRENFIQRVFVLWRWNEMLKSAVTVADITGFHARHKLIIMSHDQNKVRELGKLVASINSDNLSATAELYISKLMDTLKVKATKGNHVNVLQHVQGYLKSYLDGIDKQELSQIIEDYHQGQVPLIVPITLLNHYFRKHPNHYILDSWYMKPYPAEMSLQNSI